MAALDCRFIKGHSPADLREKLRASASCCSVACRYWGKCSGLQRRLLCNGFSVLFKLAAKEKIDGGFKDAGADNPSQALLWASCTPIMGESMGNAGFAIGSSSPQATEDAKALASACPDAYTEMPVFPKFWYDTAVDAIEKNGGPSLIDRGHLPGG
jgi:hypothetical protein